MNKSTFQLIDSGNFQKLEQIGPFRFVRPSPQAVWRPRLPKADWEKFDAKFTRNSGGDGKWTLKNQKVEKAFRIDYGGIGFKAEITDFGHIGLFAEQINNWQIIRGLSRFGAAKEEQFKVLNLFAYTGGSSLAAGQGGAHVVHLDASKTSVAWARDNAEINDLKDAPIRWITDDVQKFVAREVRRDNKYHGIILDPPSFGRGVKGEVWKIEEHLLELLDNLKKILDKNFAFVLLSSHSHGYTPEAMKNILGDLFSEYKGVYQIHEMLIGERESGRGLPSGAGCWFVRSDYADEFAKLQS